MQTQILPIHTDALSFCRPLLYQRVALTKVQTVPLMRLLDWTAGSGDLVIDFWALVS